MTVVDRIRAIFHTQITRPSDTPIENAREEIDSVQKSDNQRREILSEALREIQRITTEIEKSMVSEPHTITKNYAVFQKLAKVRDELQTAKREDVSDISSMYPTEIEGRDLLVGRKIGALWHRTIEPSKRQRLAIERAILGLGSVKLGCKREEMEQVIHNTQANIMLALNADREILHLEAEAKHTAETFLEANKAPQ